jgi:hypothetical protein
VNKFQFVVEERKKMKTMAWCDQYLGSRSRFVFAYDEDVLYEKEVVSIFLLLDMWDIHPIENKGKRP